MSELINALGLEGQMTLVQAHAPIVVAGTSPILSAAIDTRDYPNRRMILICENKETTATVYGTNFSVTESATSGGSYTASTTSGTITGLSADGVQWASIKKNPAKPFIKVTLTGTHATADSISAASVLFLQ